MVSAPGGAALTSGTVGEPVGAAGRSGGAAAATGSASREAEGGRGDEARASRQVAGGTSGDDVVDSAREVGFAAIAVANSGAHTPCAAAHCEGMSAEVEEARSGVCSGGSILGKRRQRATSAELEARLAVAAQECDTWVWTTGTMV